MICRPRRHGVEPCASTNATLNPGGGGSKQASDLQVGFEGELRLCIKDFACILQVVYTAFLVLGWWSWLGNPKLPE